MSLNYNQYEDNLETMTDEEKELIRQYMNIEKCYRYALREMSARLENLDDNCSLHFLHNPIHHIESRVKTPASIIEKMRRRDYALTLDVLKDSIMKIPGEFVLDGECCIVDINGDEDFISIVSEIKRKNWTISNPCYKVFDCLTIEEFFTNSGSVPFFERLKRIEFQEIEQGYFPHIEAVEQRVLTSKNIFDQHFQESLEKGWEGLMLRKNVGYEGKRTKNMLKVKKFKDIEAVIVDCTNGDIRFVENGKQQTYNVLSSISIEYKGNRVDIGSGFSKSQRFWYRDRHDELIGKTVTVKYFQESQNADGTYSLRFPVVKCIYDDGRDF